MEMVRVETVIESDGVLHIVNLPYQKGDQVEAMILLQKQPTEQDREAARARFLQRARQSGVQSTEPYPTRDELHERD
jgi:hypothetical protein